MEVRNLAVGRHLEIKVIRGDRIFHLGSTIEAIRDSVIYTTLIVDRYEEVFLFRQDDDISIIYRMGDRLWQWTKVRATIGLLDGDRVHAFVVPEQEGTPFNRRKMYRVFLGEDVDIRREVPDLAAIREYRAAHPEIKDLSQLQYVPECYKTVVIPGIVKDLSETGIGLFSYEKIPENSTLYLSIPTEFGKIECMCTPVRFQVEPDSRYRYFYGCHIVSVGNNIARVLNLLQRKQLGMQLHKSTEG